MPRVSRPCLPVVAPRMSLLRLGVRRASTARRTPTTRLVAQDVLAEPGRARSSSPDAVEQVGQPQHPVVLVVQVGRLGGGRGRRAGSPAASCRGSAGPGSCRHLREHGRELAGQVGGVDPADVHPVGAVDVAWAQGVPAVGEQRPRDHARRRSSRRRRRRRPARATGPGDSSENARSTEFTSSSDSGAPSASSTSPVCWAARTGTRSDASAARGLRGGVRQLERHVDERRHRRRAHRQVLGQHADAAELGGHWEARNQASSKTTPSTVESVATASAGLAVPRPGADAARGDVDVDRGHGGGEQADGADQAVAVTVAAEQATAFQRRRRVVQGRRSPSAYAASSAEARLSPSRPSRAWRGGRARPRRTAAVRRRPARRPVAARAGSARPGAAARRAARRRRVGGAEVDGRHSESRRLTVSQSLWPDGGGANAVRVSSSGSGARRTPSGSSADSIRATRVRASVTSLSAFRSVSAIWSLSTSTSLR